MKEVVESSDGGVICTHDMSFVRNSCSKVLYLDKGTVKFYGDPKKGIELYKKDNGL